MKLGPIETILYQKPEEKQKKQYKKQKHTKKLSQKLRVRLKIHISLQFLQPQKMLQERIYLETLEKTLGKIDKVIVDNKLEVVCSLPTFTGIKKEIKK